MTNNRSSLGFPNYGQQFIEVQPHRMQQKFPFLVGPVGHTFGVSAWALHCRLKHPALRGQWREMDKADRSPTPKNDTDQMLSQ